MGRRLVMGQWSRSKRARAALDGQMTSGCRYAGAGFGSRPPWLVRTAAVGRWAKRDGPRFGQCQTEVRIAKENGWNLGQEQKYILEEKKNGKHKKKKKKESRKLKSSTKYIKRRET